MFDHKLDASGGIGRHRAEKPNVEVTVGLGPMPPDASDFPGGIPALEWCFSLATYFVHLYTFYINDKYEWPSSLSSCIQDHFGDRYRQNN